MATSGFNIGNATYGRSKAGMNKLIANLQGDIKTACQAASGSEYNKFINQVRKNWSGVDADAFIERFKADVKKVKSSISGYSKKIETTLVHDNAAFRKMQSANVKKI